VISSAGRAPPLQGGCRRFDPVITHQFILLEIVVTNKLARLVKAKVKLKWTGSSVG
jgi:hypothetical protein